METKYKPQHREYKVQDHKHFWVPMTYTCSHGKRWREGHTWIKCTAGDGSCDAQSIAEYGTMGPCPHVVTG